VTIIVTLQDILAIKTVINGVVGTNYAWTINIGSVFYALAVFGLLRVFIVMWLIDDYLYSSDFHTPETATTYTSWSSRPTSMKEESPLVEAPTRTVLSLYDPYEGSSVERFHPPNNWRSILFRIIYLAPLYLFVTIYLIYIIPSVSGSAYTWTTFMMNLFYLSFLAGSTVIYACYFIIGHATNSIIPCHNTTWYKVYSLLIAAFIVVLIVFACVETRMSPAASIARFPGN
jgi:hypothetical protein